MISKRANFVDLCQKRGSALKFFVFGALLLVCVACLVAMIFTNGFAAESSDNNGNNANISNGQIAAVVGANDNNTTATTTVTDPNSTDPAEADSNKNTQQNSESVNENAYTNGESNTNSAEGLGGGGDFASGSTGSTSSGDADEETIETITIYAAIPEIHKDSEIKYTVKASDGSEIKSIVLSDTGSKYSSYAEAFSGGIELTAEQKNLSTSSSITANKYGTSYYTITNGPNTSALPSGDNLIAVCTDISYNTFEWKDYTPTPTTHTVTFEYNNGDPSTVKTVSDGTAVGKPAQDPDLTGYTFDNWYTDETSTTAYDFSQPVHNSFTLYARYSKSGTSGGASWKYYTNGKLVFDVSETSSGTLVIAELPWIKDSSLKGTITSIEMPEGVNFYGNAESMFDGLTALKSISIPSTFDKGITDMKRMFASCYSLTSLTLPYGFGQAAGTIESMFNGCSILTSLTLPDGFGKDATTFTSAFHGCTSLTSLIIPSSSRFGESATTIERMFEGCTSLTSLTLPSFFGKNVIVMKGLFEGCLNLSEVDLSGVNTERVSDAGATADKNTVFCDCNKLSKITIGDNWTFFPNKSTTRLEGLNFPNPPTSSEESSNAATNDTTYTGKWINKDSSKVCDTNEIPDGADTWTWQVKAEQFLVTVDLAGGICPESSAPEGGWLFTTLESGDIIGGTKNFDKNVTYETIMFDWPASIITPPEGQTFNGWSPTANETPLTDNTTFTALWQTPTSDPVATFDMNGGTLSSDQINSLVLAGWYPNKDYSQFTRSFTSGSSWDTVSADWKGIYPTNKDGKTATGWTNSGTPITSNTTYSAIYDEVVQYLVTADLNVGSCENVPTGWTPVFDPTYTFILSGYKYCDANKTYSEIMSDWENVKMMPPTGGTFQGWSPDVDETPLSSDVSFTALWGTTPVTQHTVTFDAKGGTPEPEPQIVNHGDTAVEPQMPLKDGYTFLEWCVGEETSYNFNDPVVEDLNLSAYWIEQGHTFEVKTSSENQTYVIGSSVPYIITVIDCLQGQFAYLTIDDKLVDASNYELGGSSTNEICTILTLKPEYLDTLKVGEHNIRVNTYGGKADTVLNVVDNNGGGDTPSVTPTNNSTVDNVSVSSASGTSSTSSTSDLNFVLFAVLAFLSVAVAIVFREYKKSN